MNEPKPFNFDQANLADQITVIGNCEHCYMHACKSASISESDDAVFYQTIADLVKDFRRHFMKEHFPNVDEKDWCILKATDTIRQRVYESSSTSHEDLKLVNELWSTVMEHIFGVDLSECIACREDADIREKEQSELPKIQQQL